MGDFNVSLNVGESAAGSSCSTLAMREFRECVDNINMSDLNQSSFQYTWNQRPNSLSGILKKIDRAMANDGFISLYTNSYVIFQPYRISDHSPAVLKIPVATMKKPKPFKFSNYIAKHADFHDTVATVWNQNIQGHATYCVVKKLHLLKSPMRKLMWSKGDIHKKESEVLKSYNEILLEEESLLKQKAKIEWLRVGDSNSAYFHRVVKGRSNRNRIETVTDSHGNLLEGAAVPIAFVQHYENFLGTSVVCEEVLDPGSLFTNRVTPQHARNMIHPITVQEVKDAVFGIGDNKSPGPDGFTAAFFKEAWDIIGNDVFKAMQQFFVNGQILREINNTVITLLPKVPSPSKSTFIPDRRIADNILLTQEIMKNYHRDRGTPRCAFKVDIQKAYDTVDWNFLEATMICFGYPMKMVEWVMACVTSTSYSICVNGDLHGFFKGRRGLRQGDPMSPYLFTLVMEVLTLMLHRNISRSDEFRFHPKCDKLKIVNLCLADDLFLFSYGNASSVKVIRDSLDEFKRCSGLTFLKALPFLLMCLCLLEIKSYWCCLLRVQLISSVLTSMQLYWCSVFILPDAIIKDIGKLLRGFLWCQGEYKAEKAKVKWDDVCLPKEEGGLGIKRLKYWNVALMTSLLWRLLTFKQSLWVKWIHEYKLSRHNIWEVSVSADSTWSWRKLLQIRPIVRKFFMYQIGDGQLASAYSCAIPQLTVGSDKLVWKSHDQLLRDCYVNIMWDSIRPLAKKVPWFHVVWFSHAIPRHAFLMWLLMGERLKTQDRLKPWELHAKPSLICVLCKESIDNHAHLFFKCFRHKFGQGLYGCFIFRWVATSGRS
ncbi:uncharacterized protein [Rutidosis leptorrhynchoides]|uniref:uncharacterized protein n=1 Tax=Rutidosis leptorrhynchoides TaxID=125765 RepID=UPI003A9A0888